MNALRHSVPSATGSVVTDRRRLAYAALIVVASVAATAPLVTGRDFCLDDAWIHLAYARSLQLGEGLSYNPGDHETGSSSPLWAFLLALIPPGSALVAHVQILGLLLHVAMSLTAAALASQLVLRAASAQLDVRRAARWAGLVAGVLSGTLPHLVQSASSGMEVSLAALLLLGAALATLCALPRAAFALGFLGVLARPETLFFSASFGALAWLRERRASVLAAAAGALCALAVWVSYCLSVSGYPWPNTMYVKGGANPKDGLAYLVLEVLLQQPWVLGISGAAVLLLGVWRGGGALRWLSGAWLATVLAISLTRDVRPGGLFFYYRYYAIVAAVPVIAIAASLAELRSVVVRSLLLVPVLVASLAQWPAVRALQRDTEQDIAQLHTEPARQLARTLPAHAVLLVEGAGAMRYFMPRSVRVVDIVGLNHGPIAHAGASLLRDCLLVAERPTHAAIPDEWRASIADLFELRPLAVVTDDVHHSGRREYRRRLHIVQVLGPTPRLREACRPLFEAQR